MAMSTVLLVANQTLAGGEVAAFVRSRMADDPADFTLLVPATAHVHRERVARTLHTLGESAPPPGPSQSEDADYEHARARLEYGLSTLKALGAHVDGVVGAPDPFEAISEVLERRHFDEIVVFTLPKGISRWLHLDLPHHVQRKFHVPVTVLTTAP
jgi:hypothetical protein